MAKILHIATPSHGRYGGVGISVMNQLSQLRYDRDDHLLLIPIPGEDCDVDFLYANLKLKAYIPDGITPLYLSRNFHKALASECVDLIHINGLWQFPSHDAAQIARKQGIPYIVTPHGMLYPEALNISRLKKKMILNLWFNKDIKEASCIHVTCTTEMNHLRLFGYNGPIAIIPNSIIADKHISAIYHRRVTKNEIQCSSHNRPIRIGYLGRIHSRKRIESIIEGMAINNNRNVTLVVMGLGDKRYTSQLQTLIHRLGLNDRVEFAGFVGGREKFRRLAELDALFVPSDMENFGMIVPEALLVGTPVMASKGTPWEELETRGCGWWRDNSPEEIAKVIEEVSLKSPQELFEMGSRGRELVLEKYEASKVAKQMIELYRWLLGEASKPDFVYLD